MKAERNRFARHDSTRPLESASADAVVEGDRLNLVIRPERERLEALAEEIKAVTDFRVRVVQRERGGPEVLHVVNPVAGARHLSEDIACRRHDEVDELWFFWSWGDDVGPADCPEGAAMAVKYVLTPEA